MGRKPARVSNHHNKKNKQVVYQQPRKADPPEQIINELLQMDELITSTKNKLKNENCHYCYLLSMKWFGTWKQYTGYANFIKQEDPQKAKHFGKRKPGYVNSDLTAKLDNYIEVPAEMMDYDYLNVGLDEKIDKSDYMVIDVELWSYIVTRYEGTSIRRPVRQLKKAPYYDVELHYFYLFLITEQDILTLKQKSENEIKKNAQTLLSIKKIQVPSIWSIKELKDFLYLLVQHKLDLKQQFELRLWKLQNFLSMKDIKISIIQTIRKENYNLMGRILEDQQYQDLDLDDFIKTSYVLFLDFGQAKWKQVPPPKQNITGHCEQCLQTKKLELICSCNRVFYCDMKCQYQDKVHHSKTCPIAYESQDDKQYESKVISPVISKCGLANVGNTCYMNSSLQCLANIAGISDYFNSNEYIKYVDQKQMKDNNAIFLKKFAKFVKKLHDFQIMIPWSLKIQISYYINAFKGYQQHDANDFIVYLLTTLNDFSSKQGDNAFAQFIANTFLGSFKSYVICPECALQSTTVDPFLQVSLPIKNKIAKKQQNYIIVQDWKHYQKGVVELKETWADILIDVGCQKESKLMIGSEGSQIKQIIEETPQEINKKFKKDYLIIYPPTAKNADYQISVNIAYCKLLAGNQAKCVYGLPFFIRLQSESYVWEIYQSIIDFINLKEDSKSIFIDHRKKVEQQWKEINEKYSTLEVQAIQIEEKQKLKKQKKKQLDAFEKKNQKIFEETFRNILGFRVNLITNRKNKRICNFCQTKCSNCPVPFNVNMVLNDLLKLTEGNSLRLEVVFNAIQQIVYDKLPVKHSQYTTLQECLIEFSKPQQLDEQNPWYCEQCDSMRLAFKQLKIASYPNVLTLHLKRFKEQNGKKVKNNEPVAYPELLVLEQKYVYKLNSVIVHEGSMEGGHYWAICRKGEDYIQFNDDTVKEKVSYFHKNAYILFYNLVKE